MGNGSAYSYIALKEAIEESGLEEKDISNEQTGIIMGSGGPSIKNVYFAVDTIRKICTKKNGSLYSSQNNGEHMFSNTCCSV